MTSPVVRSYSPRDVRRTIVDTRLPAGARTTCADDVDVDVTMLLLSSDACVWRLRRSVTSERGLLRTVSVESE